MISAPVSKHPEGPQSFTVGQPVWPMGFNSDLPWRVTGFTPSGMTYLIQNREGVQVWTTPNLLRPLRPLQKERKANGRIRTKMVYAHVILGGKP